MRFPGQWPGQGQPVNVTTQRQQTLDFVRNRGTAKLPSAPRDIVAQSGPRGVLVTWGLPQVYFDIVGYRVYKGDENTIYTEIRDRGNRQCFVESTAGSTPTVTNIFISALSQMGKESQKVQVQQKATSEAGAPAMPGSPPGYTSYSSNRTANYGKYSGVGN